MKTVFKDNWRTYLLTAGLGILAGLAVILFLEVPDHPLFSFRYWSASTFGFWMFSCSQLVLHSENRKCAAINAGIYVGLMFLLTTIHQSFALYGRGETPFRSPAEVIAGNMAGWLLYSIPAGVLCAILGAVLWSGRSETQWREVLRILPEVFLLAETAYLMYYVITTRTRLFSAATDLVCCVVYGVFLRRVSRGRHDAA